MRPIIASALLLSGCGAVQFVDGVLGTDMPQTVTVYSVPSERTWNYVWPSFPKGNPGPPGIPLDLNAATHDRPQREAAP